MTEFICLSDREKKLRGAVQQNMASSDSSVRFIARKYGVSKATMQRTLKLEDSEKGIFGYELRSNSTTKIK